MYYVAFGKSRIAEDTEQHSRGQGTLQQTLSALEVDEKVVVEREEEERQEEEEEEEEKEKRNEIVQHVN